MGDVLLFANMKSMRMFALQASFFKAVVSLCVLVLLSSCASTQKVAELKSNNSSFRVKSLIIHFTAVDYSRSVKYLVEVGGGVSSHYLIPQLNDETYPGKKIEVFQLVDETERAWHAGVSYWQGRSGLNDTSIGIEIVNVPECAKQTLPMGFIRNRDLCIFPEFESKQIDLLIDLVKGILARNPDIEPTAVIGHSDIAPGRKNDPGPRFPWQKLYEAGIGAWYENDTVEKYWQDFQQQAPSIGLIQKALHTYGYKIKQTGVLDSQSQDVLGSFQLHFVPWQVSYLPESQTVATLFALLEKYFPEKNQALIEQYQQEVQQAQQAHQLASSAEPSQLNMRFVPEEDYSASRHTFIAYENRGSMHISAKGVASADIFINGQKLNLGSFFSNLQSNNELSESFSLAKRTRTGLNSIKVDNIVEHGNVEQASLTISIPYPQLDSVNNPLQYNFDELDALIEQDVNDGLAGASVLVLHKGSIVKQSAYGYAKKFDDDGQALEKPPLLGIDTLFDIGSNTQTVATTLAVMKLVEQGQLSLDKPVYHYLAEYGDAGRETRTIADLLSHSAGYGEQVELFKQDNVLGESFYSQQKALTSQLLIERMPFSFARGTAQVENDLNFVLLGLVVERVTGMPLDEYLETKIYAPLNLHYTKFNPLSKGFARDNFAATDVFNQSSNEQTTFENMRKYTLQGEVQNKLSFHAMQGVSGNAGLFSNTKDLAILAQLLLNGGGYQNSRLFSPQTLEQFVQINGRPFALGWRTASPENAWLFGAYASAQAYGQADVNGSAIVIDPQLDLAIIFLSNKSHALPVNIASEQTPDEMYASIMTSIYETVLSAKSR